MATRHAAPPVLCRLREERHRDRLPMLRGWPVGALFAFGLALITTPAGVSGAVLLLPVQLSALHVPSPAVTPTNLLLRSGSWR